MMAKVTFKKTRNTYNGWNYNNSSNDIIITGIYIYLNANNQADIANKLLPMLLITIGFGVVGFIDDFKK